MEREKSQQAMLTDAQHKNRPSYCGTAGYHVNIMESLVARNDSLFAVVYKLVLYAIILLIFTKNKSRSLRQVRAG